MLWKTVWEFHKRLNIELLSDPKFLLLVMHLRELKTHTHMKICTLMSVTARL
jgi:hypothetical protein